MEAKDREKAQALSEALPYLSAYRGRTVVVKYGGAAMANEGARGAVAGDIALMAAVGIRTVLVHGGGPEIDAMLRAVGKEPRFVDGLRVTDEETMEIVRMVLAGKVNKEIVALIGSRGGRALGLCGIDGGMLVARRRSAELGFVGEVEKVDVSALEAAFAAGFVPVVASVAISAEPEGGFLNVNADAAAAEIAVALGAEKLLLLTDVPGVLRDPGDADTLIAELPRGDIPALRARGVLGGGMIPKVECCARAVEGGVAKAHIVDGRVPHALLLELFTDAGVGTMIA